MTQFVACKFRVEDTRTYTYAWDGEPLHDGDVVRVEDRGGGSKKVFVVSTTDDAPPFQCKPILGRHVDEPEDPQVSAARELVDGVDPLDVPLI